MEEITSLVDFEQLDTELQELILKSQDPEFYQKDNYAAILSRIHALQNILELYTEIKSSIELIRIASELGIKDEATDLKEDLIELKKFLIKALKGNNEVHPEYKGCYIKITAGAGGTESCDFASMLFRMYTLYINKQNWKGIIVNIDDKHCTAGLKSATILINKAEVYDKLKYETGVHRLVRHSPFNALNKRMTSFVSVFVYPQVEEKQIEDIVAIDESKLSFDYFRCSGAGGQNVNKVNSGVRVRYIYVDPKTNQEELILVENTETRDQPKNKENALNNLKSILYAKYKQEQDREKDEQEANKKSIEWGSQIRSYILDDGQVKDHRTNYISNSPEKILDGDIEDMLLFNVNFFEVGKQCQQI